MKDPVDRYVDLAKKLGLTKATDATSPETLRQVIDNAPDGGFRDALVNHLTSNTTLSIPAAKSVVDRAVQRVGGEATAAKNSTDTAAAVSQQATASGFAGQLELKDPMMLDEWARIAGASLMAATLLLATVFVSRMANGSSWAYGSLAALGIGSLIGMMVLIMGYKSVVISGNGSPPSG